MAAGVKRVTACCVRDAYDYLFNSDVTLATLKNVALGGRLFVSRDPNVAGVVGRSLAWKVRVCICSQRTETECDVVALSNRARALAALCAQCRGKNSATIGTVVASRIPAIIAR